MFISSLMQPMVVPAQMITTEMSNSRITMTDWGITLFSNKYGYKLAIGFTKI